MTELLLSYVVNRVGPYRTTVKVRGTGSGLVGGRQGCHRVRRVNGRTGNEGGDVGKESVVFRGFESGSTQ